MDSRAPASIQFTLNGQRYQLGRIVVENRLANITPEVIRKHSVRVNETWFPVIQAFEVALGVPRSTFMSSTARRHLSALGFEVSGDVEPRTSPPASLSLLLVAPKHGPAADEDSPFPVQGEWHTETNVQAALVSALAADGWRILSVANTATKEHGIDVIASRDGQTVGVEVKGFPSRNYADPARAGEAKRTSPSTQAGHWYSQAILAAMRLRGKEPQWRSVIALPDFPRYRDLYSETAGSLEAAEIDVWWIAEDGALVKT